MLNKPNILHITLFQMNIKFGDKKYNIERVKEFLDNNRGREAKDNHLIILPELFSTGYDLINYRKHSELINGPTMTLLKQMSKKFSVALAGSLIEKDNDDYFNSAFLIDSNGEMKGHYRKIHLFRPMKEDEYFTIGNFVKNEITFQLNQQKLGLLICYDLRFPEVSRKIANNGASLLIYVAEFPNPRKDVWKTLLQARAIENQIHVVGVNRVGTDENGYSFFGNSMIIDPNGSILVECSNHEEIISYSLDLSNLSQFKELFNYKNDLQPDLY